MSRRIVYRMGVSLDGFIAAPGDDIGWTTPDEELFGFHVELLRTTAFSLYGRKLYEVMRYWETADEDPDLPEQEREWARLWKATPRIVFSRTLDRVEGGATLFDGDLDKLDGIVTVGGAGLAASFIERDLIDEYGVIVNPIVLGAGTPFFPPLATRLALTLIETRTFAASGVQYLRYERKRA
jgi:dihydrofolate reductase